MTMLTGSRENEHCYLFKSEWYVLKQCSTLSAAKFLQSLMAFGMGFRDFYNFDLEFYHCIDVLHILYLALTLIQKMIVAVNQQKYLSTEHVVLKKYSLCRALFWTFAALWWPLYWRLPWITHASSPVCFMYVFLTFMCHVRLSKKKHLNAAMHGYQIKVFVISKTSLLFLNCFSLINFA